MLFKKARRKIKIVLDRGMSRILGWKCPDVFGIQRDFDSGNYARAGKNLLFFYGPCKLNHLPDVNHYLAEYYYAVGDEEKHLFHLDKALSLYNQLNDPYGIGRAQIYSIMARDQIGKDTAKVIEYCKQGLEISVHEPINMVLHYWLYEVYDETGEYVLSKEHKEKYEQICRDNEPYLYQREHEPFLRIDANSRKAGIPLEKWTCMTAKEQRKALIKVGKYL